MKKKCIHCKKEFEGRIDRLYCSVYCKSDYHYKKNKDKQASFYSRVEKQLKLNHRLLKHYNTAGKSTIRKEKLLQAGFNPRIFTHYWKTQKGHIYLFCYDYGFWETMENNKSKYILVRWQPDYMTIPNLAH